MKKIFLGFSCLSLLLLAACQALEEIPSIPTYANGDETMQLVKSGLARETVPDDDEDLVRTVANDNASFALQFYEQIRTKNGNIIFSPLSLSLALSMTLAGAETSTEEGMLEALQVSLSEADLHPALNAMMLKIEKSQQHDPEDMEGDPFQLNIANSIWGQADYDFKEPFLETLARHYGAGIFTVNFKQQPDESRKAINGWVSDETAGKIQDIIPPGSIDPLTRLVLASAIYFNGSWLHPFNKSATSEAPFSTLDNATITVNMMRLSGERFLYALGDDYQAINLPYVSSDFAMTLIVPDQGQFPEFETEIDQERLTGILSNMAFERVDLEMPNFDFETDTNANDALIALGMGDAFDAKFADFSGITDEEDLMITNVLHKATITVDEDGTEAAAATAVIVGIKSAMPEEPISLVIDRPFLFMIRHLPTDSILFMGRVLEP